MKFKTPQLFLFALMALLLAALLAVLPSWLGTALAAWNAEARNRALAQGFEQFLADIEGDLAAPEKSEEDPEKVLAYGLTYQLMVDRSVVAYFTVDSQLELSAAGMIGSLETAKFEARQVLQKDDDVAPELEEELELLAEDAAPVSGVKTVRVEGRPFQVVWRKTGGAVRDLVSARVYGFVVDGSLVSDDVLMRAVRRLLVGLGAGMVLLLAAAVGVLVFFLWKARREALQKTTFVSNVSHELRTPLTSLMSYAEMLATGRCRTEEKKAKALGVILDEGRRLNRMILELLDFSRLERGTRRYVLEDFDLAETVRETVERLGARFAAHGITVETPDAVAVTSDRDTVRQILENLLTNAAKYAAKDGPVEVSAKVRDGRVKLEVADRGPGMTRSQMKHAFDAFWRADNSTTRETNGYGIGLAVARGYARGLGGDLSVAARPDGGCTFAFEFPTKQ